MILISYGMQRSSSSFSYKLATEIAESLGHNQKKLRQRLPKVYQRHSAQIAGDPTVKNEHPEAIPLEELVPIFDDGSIYVLKTHSSPSKALIPYFETGQIRCTATYRDPRDIAISLLDVGKRNREKSADGPFTHIFEMKHAIEIAKGELFKFQRWLAMPNVLIIPFKANSLNPVLTAALISDYLDVTVDINKIAQTVTVIKPNFNKGIEKRYKSRMTEHEVQHANNQFFRSMR